MARKAYKYRLYPNKTTEKKLYFTLNRCRELYNACLSERKDSYKLHERITLSQNAETGQIVAATMIANQRVSEVSYYGQKRDLVDIKQDREEYQDIASHVLQDVILRVERAFQRFFDRLKNGETPGYPRFKGRDRYDSFTYPDGAGWKRDRDRLRLTKIGTIKMKLHRPLEGTIKTVTIKREVDQWYVVFTCEVSEQEKLPLSYEDVGIDLGVTHLATLSNGEMIEHPRYYRKAQKRLEKRQQALSRKKKGSHRRTRAKKLIGRAHKKIRNQRRDFLHKQSRQIVNRYQVIVFEDIQIGNLIKRPKPKQDEFDDPELLRTPANQSRKSEIRPTAAAGRYHRADEQGKYLPNGAAAKGGLSKSILDAGWGMFMQMCKVKAEGAGRCMLKVNPKYTSQVCSKCGTVRKKTLEERWHSCDCGAEMDRDVNAAINILALGKKTLV